MSKELGELKLRDLVSMVLCSARVHARAIILFAVLVSVAAVLGSVAVPSKYKVWATIESGVLGVTDYGAKITTVPASGVLGRVLGSELADSVRKDVGLPAGRDLQLKGLVLEDPLTLRAPAFYSIELSCETSDPVKGCAIMSAALKRLADSYQQEMDGVRKAISDDLAATQTEKEAKANELALLIRSRVRVQWYEEQLALLAKGESLVPRGETTATLVGAEEIAEARRYATEYRLRRETLEKAQNRLSLDVERQQKLLDLVAPFHVLNGPSVSHPSVIKRLVLPLVAVFLSVVIGVLGATSWDVFRRYLRFSL